MCNKYFKYSGNRLPQDNLVIKSDFRIWQAVNLIACMIEKVVEFAFMLCYIYNDGIFGDFLNGEDWLFPTFTPEKKSLSIEDDNPELPGKKQLKWL